MICRRSLLAAATLLPIASTARAADDPTARIERNLVPRIVLQGRPELPRSLAERMAHYRVPGVSLAFFDDKQLLWTRQHGVLEAGANRKVDAETLFQASSVSKIAAALAILRLVREGRLDLDADVAPHLTAWRLGATPFTATQKVTVRRLLSHSAGVTVHGFAGYAPADPLPTPVQILSGAPPANNPPVTVDTVPGSAWRYSGGGYMVLQQLAEEATGEPFAATLQRTVLAPAGMARSRLDQPLPPALWANAGKGHATDGRPLPGGAMVFPELAPAGLWSTPSDLARMAITLNAEATGGSDQLMGRALAGEMLKSQAGDWGLGVDLTAIPGEASFSHVGTNPGYQAYLIFIPGRRQGLAVMTNGASQSGFFLEIVMAVAREYGWPGFAQTVRDTVSVPPAVLEGYAGSWLADGAPAFEVIARDGRLFVQGGPFGPELVELHAETPARFFILSTGFTFDFTEVGDGRAVLGGSIAARRLPARPTDR
ncbi:MAG: serine hydrolase domain-containing protein [Caulobacter sp.]|nr:serine hydrolase domain-containing protein [Caulobacter sp.]